MMKDAKTIDAMVIRFRNGDRSLESEVRKRTEEIAKAFCAGSRLVCASAPIDPSEVPCLVTEELLKGLIRRSFRWRHEHQSWRSYVEGRCRRRLQDSRTPQRRKRDPELISLESIPALAERIGSENEEPSRMLLAEEEGRRMAALIGSVAAQVSRWDPHYRDGAMRLYLSEFPTGMISGPLGMRDDEVAEVLEERTDWSWTEVSERIKEPLSSLKPDMSYSMRAIGNYLAGRPGGRNPLGAAPRIPDDNRH